jgi:hypothetical protein
MYIYIYYTHYIHKNTKMHSNKNSSKKSVTMGDAIGHVLFDMSLNDYNKRYIPTAQPTHNYSNRFNMNVSTNSKNQSVNFNSSSVSVQQSRGNGVYQGPNIGFIR